MSEEKKRTRELKRKISELDLLLKRANSRLDECLANYGRLKEDNAKLAKDNADLIRQANEELGKSVDLMAANKRLAECGRVIRELEQAVDWRTRALSDARDRELKLERLVVFLRNLVNSAERGVS